MACADALIASGVVPQLTGCLLDFAPEANAKLRAAGFDQSAAGDRLSEVRGY